MSNPFPKTDEEWDALFAAMDRHIEAQELKRKNPYVLDLIRVLRPRESGMDRQMVLHSVRKNREHLGLPIPPKFEEAVQGTCNWYCVDSDVFRGRSAPPEDGLFSWPQGKGKGRWSARPEQCDAWLRANAHKRNI